MPGFKINPPAMNEDNGRTFAAHFVMQRDIVERQDLIIGLKRSAMKEKQEQYEKCLFHVTSVNTGVGLAGFAHISGSGFES